jgi:hypothetical protein
MLSLYYIYIYIYIYIYFNTISETFSPDIINLARHNEEEEHK